MNRIVFFIIIFSLQLLIYNSFIYNIKELEIILKGIIVVNFFIYLFKNYKKIRKKEIKLFIIGIIIFIFLKKYYFAVVIIMISKNLKKELRLKLFLVSAIINYLIVIFLYNLGNLNTGSIIEREFSFAKVIRYSLGFGHPNSVMLYLIPILLSIYYLYYKKKIGISFIILLITLFFFKLTYSRTTMLLMILLVILTFIKDKYFENFRIFIYWEALVLSGISVFLSKKFSGSILDRLFSYRFSWNSYYLSTYEISYFPNLDKFTEYVKNIPFDNFYLKVLFESGIIGFMIMLFLIFYILKSLYKDKDFCGIRILILIILSGIMEAGTFAPMINIIYIILYDYL